MELRNSLAEVVNAAFGGNGWDDVDPLFQRQKDALIAFDKELKLVTNHFVVVGSTLRDSSGEENIHVVGVYHSRDEANKAGREWVDKWNGVGYTIEVR